MRGASEYCCRAAFGGNTSASEPPPSPPPLPPSVCENEGKKNIDWVFSDAAAKTTYRQQYATGKSSFESVVGAQGHNPHVQAILRGCQTWAEVYLRTLSAPDGGVTLTSRPLTSADCKCVSVLPTSDFDSQKRLAYRVVNSCDGLLVSVQFGSDIQRVSPDPTAFSSVAQAGLMGTNQEHIVRAPGGTVVSINAIGMRSAVNSITCPMFR